ncbi:MAG TPA: F0F1 ATP synthase subunit B [Flavobacteriales bacterium]|jgi:F-type H+-transporting ATPase subunit b|nr:F0F1 ATP synthase subunit B [Flavobacteriales bacterium]
MELVTPGIGLIFWTTIVFLVLVWLLQKFAWKPILNAVNDREESITKALDAAEEAKKELEQLQASNEELLREAREERDRMLKEAREVKDQMISEAKGKAREEADFLMKQARESIESEKSKAIMELKNQVAEMSIDIAGKILRENLTSDESQHRLAEKYVNDINLN